MCGAAQKVLFGRISGFSSLIGRVLRTFDWQTCGFNCYVTIRDFSPANQNRANQFLKGTLITKKSNLTF